MIDISLSTHGGLYRDWRKALDFARAIPDAPPASPVVFHMFWRNSRGPFWRRRRTFGRKQALPVKAFYATQDLSRCRLIMWSDEDLSSNPWLQSFGDRLECRVYAVDDEVRGTAIADHPALFRQRDRKVWRDGDLFRILVLHNYGGVYVDMDMVLLRSIGALLDQEFVYQWEHYENWQNGAIMHAHKGSALTRALIDGVIELPPGNFNWGRENLQRAARRGVAVTVFPSAFFDTEWTADHAFQPFRRTPASRELYDGAFAWHWHNKWDEAIEPGSKFEILEAAMDDRLMKRGFAAAPALA